MFFVILPARRLTTFQQFLWKSHFMTTSGEFILITIMESNSISKLALKPVFLFITENMHSSVALLHGTEVNIKQSCQVGALAF